MSDLKTMIEYIWQGIRDLIGVTGAFAMSMFVISLPLFTIYILIKLLIGAEL